MNESNICCHYKDLRTQLLPKLRGTVFHVTTEENYRKICEARAIISNSDGKFDFTWNVSEISFFRRKSCVSLVDLRVVTDEELDVALGKYYFLNPRFTCNKPVYLFLESFWYDDLIPWTEWKDAKLYSQMIVPYIEAGYKDRIEIIKITKVLIVKIDKPIHPLEEALRKRGFS